MKNLKRIWKNYNKWEDFIKGFYNTKTKYDQDTFDKVVKTLTTEEFYECGLKIFEEWPNSINHNLSYAGSNRKSYIGQAVCCFLHGLSAKTTAEIFTKMNKDDQDRANHAAERLISVYEKSIYVEEE